jgi:hypothetical protein
MPKGPQLIRAKRKLTSSTTRDYSGLSKSKGPKVRNLLQMQKEKWLLDDQRENERLREFFIIFASVHALILSEQV